MPCESVCKTDKIYLLGEKGSGTHAKGPIQNFYELRRKHLKEGILFEDENFPANDSSMYFTKKASSDIEWKRPNEIKAVRRKAQFFVDGHSRFDAIQGENYNCWLVAAISNLTIRNDLVAQVVPDDQDFGENYAGIFHFRFWQYGKWVDVVVDDRLPYSKSMSKLYYLRSRQKNEFWSPLLEKAYAKLNGSYEALYHGIGLDSMQDFTGGLTEVYRTGNTPENLFEILLKAQERSALITCAMKRQESLVLLSNHTYSITKVKYITRTNSQEKLPLIRLRNPWSDGEWKGAWSDSSKEWQSISDDERKEIGLVKDRDGEFWMSYEDFEFFYIRVEICNLCPHSAPIDHLDHKNWKVSSFESKWVRGINAGGQLSYKDTFHHNPQYTITLTQTDIKRDQCTLIIGLLQKFRRQQRLLGVKNLLIGCEIFKLDDTTTPPLDANFFQNHVPAADMGDFVRLREYTNTVILPPGRYCIIPCTNDVNEEGEFLLRVFSEELNTME